MRLEDVKEGMRVVPHSKSVMSKLNESAELYKAELLNQKFLYVNNASKISIVPDNYIMLSTKPTGIEGDYFLSSDFNEYIEEPKIVKHIIYLYHYEPVTIFDKNMRVIDIQKSPRMKKDYSIITQGKVTTVILSDGTKGSTKCSNTDIYSHQKGHDIAYKRALIKSLKNELKELIK